MTQHRFDRVGASVVTGVSGRLLVVTVLVALLASCSGDGRFLGNNDVPPDLEITIANETADWVWVVGRGVDSDRRLLTFEESVETISPLGVPAGGSQFLGKRERSEDRDRDGGCVTSMAWFFRSVSGQVYWENGAADPTPEQVENDLEVLATWTPNETCFESDVTEFIITDPG